MRELVESILVKNEERLNRIVSSLDQLGVEYRIETENDATNLIVPIEGKNKASGGFITLGAHYDLYQDSIGINDNSCAVALLLDFIKETLTNKPNKDLEIVFFDKEETGMVGSSNYAAKYKDKIDYAIIFDIIGYGDTLIYGNNRQNEKIQEVFKNLKLKQISPPLPSDNMTFSHKGVPVALITATHRDDLCAIPDVDEFGETYYFKRTPKFYSSFHNRENDNKMEIINFPLIEKLKNILVSTFLTKSVLCNSEGV